MDETLLRCSHERAPLTCGLKFRVSTFSEQDLHNLCMAPSTGSVERRPASDSNVVDAPSWCSCECTFHLDGVAVQGIVPNVLSIGLEHESSGRVGETAEPVAIWRRVRQAPHDTQSSLPAR